MKNKKIIYKSISAIMLVGLSFGTVSCDDSNLEDVENKGAFDSSNYFKDEQQAFTGLVASYDLL